jgi:carbamoyl-phosphate synthase large subunit
MTTRIAVTGAGGPSAVSLIQALGDRDTALFAGDIDPYAPGLYLVPRAHRWLLPSGGDAGFVDELLARCVDDAVDVLVPTVDVELLAIARRRTEFEERHIRVLLAHERTLIRCLDKASLALACADVCPVPRTTILHGEADVDDWPCPFLVKPRLGAGSRGVRLIRQHADLAGVPCDGTYVAQEYLPGLEHSVDVLATLDGDVVAAVPRSRLKIDSGIAVTGMTVHDPTLERHARAVATALGVIYVANIQFREDEGGVPHLIDVNARFPGAMPMTVAAGINMPCLALDLCLGRPLPADCGEFREIAMVRTWREHFLDTQDMIALEQERLRRSVGAVSV